MKKKIIVLLAGVIFTMATMTGCGNKQVFDFTYTFDNAIIQLPNGQVIEGKIDSWTDYEDGDQIQVKIDGTMYLVHSSNIALIKK